MKPSKQRRAPQDILIEAARNQVGYQALANKDTPFGQRTGYPNQKWDGSFVEYCLRATGSRHNGLPSHVSTTAALQWYVQNRRAYKDPRPGDVVFYAFSTDDVYSEPHVGVVTDVSEWKTDGKFRAVEGQINSGLPRARKQPDGVFERVRFATDVILFGRPYLKSKKPKTEPESKTGEPVKVAKVRVSHFQNGKIHPSVALTQIMLSETVGLSEVHRGLWDAKTRSAYAAWQRQIGYVGRLVTGEPDIRSLQALADTRKQPLFEVRG